MRNVQSHGGGGGGGGVGLGGGLKRAAPVTACRVASLTAVGLGASRKASWRRRQRSHSSHVLTEGGSSGGAGTEGRLAGAGKSEACQDGRTERIT